jgi:beta-glucanase (GH16 family)
LGVVLSVARDLLLLFALVLFVGAAEAGAQRVTPPSGYELVWADEFSADGWPDPRNWTYERGFVRNNEHQWYQADNAVVKDGYLVIEARRESKANPTFEAGSTDWRRSRERVEYTSASMSTRGLHSFRYGRFEMRARIDVRPGMWPAFWTLGDVGRWPANGEIDIMEYYRDSLLANVAWGSDVPNKAIWDDSRKALTALGDASWSSKFHVWRMDWDENEIRIYVDDVLLNSTDLHTTINKDGPGKNPLQQPHYIVLNLAIGGNNGGDPSATKFPARYEVDYVRVFRKIEP